MSNNGDSTFSVLMLFRVFTISGANPLTDKTLSFDNVAFVGDEILIKYTNTKK